VSPACARRRFVTAKARSLSVDIPGEIECSTRTLQCYLKRQPYADAREHGRHEVEGPASAGAEMAKAAAVDGSVSAVAWCWCGQAMPPRFSRRHGGPSRTPAARRSSGGLAARRVKRVGPQVARCTAAKVYPHSPRVEECLSRTANATEPARDFGYSSRANAQVPKCQRTVCGHAFYLAHVRPR
jgi:hypothetical protein